MKILAIQGLRMVIAHWVTKSEDSSAGQNSIIVPSLLLDRVRYFTRVSSNVVARWPDEQLKNQPGNGTALLES